MESGALSQFSKATPQSFAGRHTCVPTPSRWKKEKTRLQGHPQLHETQGLRKTALL